MNPAILYVACLVGAVGLYLLLRPVAGDVSRARPIKAVGILLGLGAFAWLLVDIGRRIGGDQVGTVEASADGAVRAAPTAMFVIFSLIALGSAVRMITHSKPVYSALYFVMVVLSSAGLFLLLQAEFMAFALIIVYAGAILITYMFVLMLAQQAPGAEATDLSPEYDRIPREPGMAAAVGFMLLALFSHMIAEGTGHLQVATLAPAPVSLGAEGDASNIHLVGLDLVAKFPVSLELAGIILLLAMFGAVVLARKQIELGEDEVREAAGMRKLALHSDHHDGETARGATP